MRNMNPSKFKQGAQALCFLLSYRVDNDSSLFSVDCGISEVASAQVIHRNFPFGWSLDLLLDLSTSVCSSCILPLNLSYS